MFKLLKNKSGMGSMIEILITSVVFATAVAGILAATSSVKPQSTQAMRKLQAAQIGKSMIDQLRSSIDAQTWNQSSGNLYPNTYNTTKGIYNITYTITDVPDMGLRKLTMNISYPD